MNIIKHLVGLFVPVWKNENGKICTTMSISNVPLGWIIVAISVVVNLIMN